MEKIAILIARKRDLEEKLAAVSRLISAYESLDREMQALLDGEPQDTVTLPRAVETSPATQTRARSKDVVAFETAVRDILSKANEPLDRESLLAAVRSHGVEVGGAEPLNTLGARVFRMTDVASRRGEGYFLKVREREFFPSHESTAKQPIEDDGEIDSLV